MRLLSPHALGRPAARRALVFAVLLTSGCAGLGGTGGQRGAKGSWPADVPPIRNAGSREQIPLSGGGVVLFFRHTGPFQSAFSDLVEDLTAGGWQILDVKGSLYSQSMSGCGPSCDDLRFYAVTRRLGPRSETLLRVASKAEIRPEVGFETPCVPVPLARAELDESSRFGPIYDVDLDRDGRLDAYAPRFDGERVVWDAYAMRGACGHPARTFPRLPADPHTTEMGESGLVDLTVSEPVVDEDGRERKVPVTYRFDGTSYLRPEPS